MYTVLVGSAVTKYPIAPGLGTLTIWTPLTLTPPPDVWLALTNTLPASHSACTWVLFADTEVNETFALVNVPLAPVAPLGPEGPVAPVAPVGPGGPLWPGAPVAPVGPVGPRLVNVKGASFDRHD
jgi:hypothetical protein